MRRALRTGHRGSHCGRRDGTLLAAQILATRGDTVAEKVLEFKKGLNQKIVKANEALKEVEYRHKVD